MTDYLTASMVWSIVGLVAGITVGETGFTIHRWKVRNK